MLQDVRRYRIEERLMPNTVGQGDTRYPDGVDKRHNSPDRARVLSRLPLNLGVVDAIDVENVVLGPVNNWMKVRSDFNAPLAERKPRRNKVATGQFCIGHPIVGAFLQLAVTHVNAGRQCS